MKQIITFLKLFVVLFILSGSLFAQVTQEWVSRYNGPGNGSDDANSMAVDGSGNVYVTGYSYGSGTSHDYATIKYNSSGVQQWVSRYNGLGNGSDDANSIAVDGSGNVYVTGSSYGTSADYATIKYNPQGDTLWVRRYNGPADSSDGASSMAVDGSGNVYVTGYSYGSGTSADYATIKYNSSGVQQWVSRYNGPTNGSDYATSIAVDGSGNVYVTGNSYGTSADYVTIKYNSSGVQQWTSSYNGPGNYIEQAFSIAVDGSGNVYVTGNSYGSGTSADYATIKYNSSGVQQWVSRYDGPGSSNDYAYSIAVDGSGNVYVTGRSVSSLPYCDYATIKYNPQGDTLWVRRYNGPGNMWDVANSIAIDGSGNVYVTGYSYGSGNENYATIKYSASGVQQWVQAYNGPGNNYDMANVVIVDTSGNVYATGGSYGSGTSHDYATIKYSQPVEIQIISTQIPKSYELFQNYPNPFNPKTIINFELPKYNFVTLKIYDALGREVSTLVNEQLKAGTYQVDWDGSSYTSGIYFYRFTSGNFAETKKMVLIK